MIINYESGVVSKTTNDELSKEELSEKDIYRLKELIALAMLEYVKKNKEQLK